MVALNYSRGGRRRAPVLGACPAIYRVRAEARRPPVSAWRAGWRVTARVGHRSASGRILGRAGTVLRAPGYSRDHRRYLEEGRTELGLRPGADGVAAERRLIQGPGEDRSTRRGVPVSPSPCTEPAYRVLNKRADRESLSLEK